MKLTPLVVSAFLLIPTACGTGKKYSKKTKKDKEKEVQFTPEALCGENQERLSLANATRKSLEDRGISIPAGEFYTTEQVKENSLNDIEIDDPASDDPKKTITLSPLPATEGLAGAYDLKTVSFGEEDEAKAVVHSKRNHLKIRRKGVAGGENRDTSFDGYYYQLTSETGTAWLAAQGEKFLEIWTKYPIVSLCADKVEAE